MHVAVSRFLNEFPIVLMQTLRAFVLLLVVVGLAAGCDGFDTGTPPNQQAAPTPTVQFATENLGAVPSDSIVTMTVSLQNPDGREATVEILYAQQASSATPADLNGFTRTTGITFGAVSGDTTLTQTVEVDISDANISDGRKEALFALQNLQSDGKATLGETRQLTLNIGFPPLSDVREGGPGTSGIFAATVTEVSGEDVRVQDETAGIYVSRNSEFSGAVSRGDRVRISGTLSTFANQLQIDQPSDLESFEVLSSGNDLPEPTTITLAEAAENPDEYESELVRVENITISPGGDETFQAGGSAGNYTVTDEDGNSLTLRIPGDSFYGGEAIPDGQIAFEGVLGEFFEDVQLRARYEEDIVVP
jgi:hypothetical protein